MSAPVLIIAPCPIGRGAAEGWMSRIRAVDRIFAGQPRVYLDVVSGEVPLGPPVATTHGEALEYRLDLLRPSHRHLLETLLQECRFAYVHTIHLARFLLPYYPTGKIVTDIHGIVPEEERMLGRRAHGDFYEAVEATVMATSRLLVVVTEAMRDHLLAKYPDCHAEFLVLPIIEPHAVDLAARQPRQPGTPYRAVYAGGTQAWQNIDDTLAICASVREVCRFDFLSHEHVAISRMPAAEALGEAARFRVVDKAALAEAYLQADFGFVLRDPVAVNIVSCPTKLSEYLWFGVVPVVKTAAIGDFERLGYAYLTMSDFAGMLFPDEEALAEMRAHNRAIIETLAGRFGGASVRLASLSLPNRIHGTSLGGLPVGQQHLVLPSQAEIYLLGKAQSYHAVPLAALPDRLAIRFDPPQPANCVRLVPLLADMAVTLESVTLDLASDALPRTARVAVAGPVARGPEGAAVCHLRREGPFIDIHLDGAFPVAGLEVRLAFQAVGAGAVLVGAGGHEGRLTLRCACLTGAVDLSAPLRGTLSEATND
jgi:hypothetical protein